MDEWKKKIDRVNKCISAGHRAGVCDGEGRSVKRNGVFVARPRYLSGHVKRLCNKCRKWYYREHTC
jgi:hypothetical protein